MRNASDRIDADEMSKRLREGSLRAVFHGAPEMLNLKELVRNYHNLVEDATRVMLRIKAIFRARAISTPGVSVYRASQRKQWLAKLEGGARVRATSLLSQLDMLLELRPKAKAAMIDAARRHMSPHPSATNSTAPTAHARTVGARQSATKTAASTTSSGHPT